jgi:alpha-L-rhamnosidase
MPVHATALKTEYLREPLAVASDRPRLFWRIDGVANDGEVPVGQSAYRVLVATSLDRLEAEEGDLWDSGKVESNETTHISYEGEPLAEGRRAHWKVLVWDAEGNEGAWSRPSFWERSLPLRAAEQGSGPLWLSAALHGSGHTSTPAPYFRRTFDLTRPIVRARLRITALGIHHTEINGRPVSADVFRPGWTDYHSRLYFDTYDVTELLTEGENAIGVILGDGWYAGHIGGKDREQYGTRPAVLAELRVELSDGSTEVIGTDTLWRYSYGAVLSSDLIMGEEYDARQHPAGYSEPGFDATEWLPPRIAALEAEIGPEPEIEPEPTPNEPVRRTKILTPISEPMTGSHGWRGHWRIYDLGQNMVGRARLTLRGPAGATVRLRHAEALDADGMLYTENLRSARAIDYYTLSGGERETYEPLFTFHGFRYLELNTHDPSVEVLSVEGVVLHNDFEPAGSFSSSHPLVNKLQSNIQWGQRGNFLEVPTDCPQRDERLGWTGDAQVFARTACFNMDVAAFFRKWLADLRDAQRPSGSMPHVAPRTGLGEHGGPAWADAAVIVPWTVYLQYGDTEVLRENLPMMRRLLDYVRDELTKDGVAGHPEAYPWGGFGDWLALDNGGRVAGRTPKDLIGTAFYAYSSGLVARAARVLGDSATADDFAARADAARSVFQGRFVSEKGLLVSSTQTAYVLALHFDLLRPEQRQTALDALVRDIVSRDYHLSTGFVGTPYLLHVLSDNGRADVAGKLLLQEELPGWLYQIHMGATTMWERWTSYTAEEGFATPDMNSFNHYAYGAVGDWMYRKLAGLDFEEASPGYRKLRVRPVICEGFESVSASINTLHGRAAVSWSRSGASLNLELDVPPNCSAEVFLPKAEGGYEEAVQRPSGTHGFSVPLQAAP